MKLNYWFLTATLELCLAFVLIISGAMKPAAFAAALAAIFIMIGMIREHQKGL